MVGRQQRAARRARQRPRGARRNGGGIFAPSAQRCRQAGRADRRADRGHRTIVGRCWAKGGGLVMRIEQMQAPLQRAAHENTPEEEARSCAVILAKAILAGDAKLVAPGSAPKRSRLDDMIDRARTGASYTTKSTRGYRSP